MPTMPGCSLAATRPPNAGVAEEWQHNVLHWGGLSRFSFPGVVNTLNEATNVIRRLVFLPCRVYYLLGFAR